MQLHVLHRLRIATYILVTILVCSAWYSVAITDMQVKEATTYVALAAPVPPPAEPMPSFNRKSRAPASEPVMEEHFVIVAPAPVEEDFWDKLFSYFPDLDGEYALYASGLFIPIVLYFFKRLIDFFFAYLRSKLIKVEAT